MNCAYPKWWSCSDKMVIGRFFQRFSYRSSSDELQGASLSQIQNAFKQIEETGLQLLQRHSLTSVSCIKGPKKKLQRGSSKKPCNLSLKKQLIALAEDVVSFSSSIGVFVYSPIKMYMYKHEDVLKEYGGIYLHSKCIYIPSFYVHIITMICVCLKPYRHIHISYKVFCIHGLFLWAFKTFDGFYVFAIQVRKST